MKNELLKGLSEEQIAKVKACKKQEELLKLAKKEGIELTDEQLEGVSGGMCTSTPNEPCRSCGSWNVKWEKEMTDVSFHHSFTCTCKDCGAIWHIDSPNL